MLTKVHPLIIALYRTDGKKKNTADKVIRENAERITGIHMVQWINQ
jgi:hypothetical protein